MKDKNDKNPTFLSIAIENADDNIKIFCISNKRGMYCAYSCAAEILEKSGKLETFLPAKQIFARFFYEDMEKKIL